MIVQKAIYDIGTGRINRIYSGVNFDQTGAGEAELNILEKNWHQYDDLTHYVSGGAIIARPDNTASIDKLAISADAVDAATISNISNPSTVTVTAPDGSIQSFNETDGEFVLTSDTLGVFKIKIESFPQLDKVFEIVAT